MKNKTEKINKNILFLCMSDLRYKSLNYYCYNNRYYKCVSQLEAGTKTVIDTIVKNEVSEPLNIIVFNTEETLNDNKLIKGIYDDSDINNEYDFYKKRINDYVTDCEDNAPFKVDDIEDEILKTDIDNKVVSFLENDDNNRDLNERLKEYEDQIINDVVDVHLKKRYATEEQKDYIEEALNHVTDNSSKTHDNTLDELNKYLSQWTSDLANDLNNSNLDMAALNLIDNKIENAKKEITSPSFHMIMGYQTSYRKLRMVMRLQLAKLQDKLSAYNTDSENYSSINSESDIIIEKLVEISLKLKQEIEDNKNNYRNRIILYIRQLLCEMFVDNLNDSISHDDVIVKFRSIEIKHGIEEKMDEIESVIFGNESDCEYNIYFDTQGGARDNVVMMSAVMELFKSRLATQYKELRIETLATNYNNNNRINNLYSNKEKYETFDLVGGINEFSKFFKVGRLKKYIEKNIEGRLDDQSKGNDNVVVLFNNLKKLLDKLDGISSDLYLCKLDGIGNDITEVNKLINGRGKEKGIKCMIDDLQDLPGLKSTMKILNFIVNHINMMLVIPTTREDKVSIAKLIGFCLKMDMLQQAVTLAAESTPLYLFEKGIVSVPAESKLKEGNKGIRIDNTNNANGNPFNVQYFKESFSQFWIINLNKIVKQDSKTIGILNSYKYMLKFTERNEETGRSEFILNISNPLELVVSRHKYSNYDMQESKSRVEEIVDFTTNNYNPEKKIYKDLRSEYEDDKRFITKLDSFKKRYDFVNKNCRNLENCYAGFLNYGGFSKRWSNFVTENLNRLSEEELKKKENVEKLIDDWMIYYTIVVYNKLKTLRNDTNHASDVNVQDLKKYCNCYIKTLEYFEL